MTTLDRRGFLAAAILPALAGRRDPMRGPRILLRSSWQTVNIGDVGHTPGLIALIERELPDAEVRLWPSDVGQGVAAMLRKRFPRLVILQSATDRDAAFSECDFLLHGSGPSLVAAADLARWRDRTGKPYGVAGITQSRFDEPVRSLLDGARFVYFRDTVSLELARAAGIRCPILEFGPDAAFAVDLRDDAAALAFLDEHDLEPGRFACCLSRFRHTPYWLVKPNVALDLEKARRNETMKEHDHRPLREAIERVVRETDLKVLLCPEDATQMAIAKELLLDPLPAAAKRRVVWRERFWLTDEALSVYVRSAGLFGSEMHSPIMAVGNGVPAIVCRFAEQTSKGFMWRDIGLGQWLFDLDDEADHDRIAPAVLEMLTHVERSRAAVATARSLVADRHGRVMKALSETLNATAPSS